MSKTIMIPHAQGNYTPGQYISSEVAIPAGKTQCEFMINRQKWTDTGLDVANFIIETSFDNGLTWPDKVSFSLKCGNIIDDRTGVPRAVNAVSFGLLDNSNPNRKIRVISNIVSAINCKSNLRII